jgi:hypothetical protein
MNEEALAHWGAVVRVREGRERERERPEDDLI